MKTPDLTLVLPAYNEAQKISSDLDAMHKYFEEQSYSTEILIVEDGSRDTTKEVVRSWIQRSSFHRISAKLIDYGNNRGKGFAVKTGMLKASGKICGFLDVGMCVPLKYVEVAREKLEGGAQVAIGSRRTVDSLIQRKQPWHRRAGSKLFWYLMRTFMGIRVSDTQCGFKFYQREAAREIFSRVETTGFMFDVEALMLASHLKMNVVEFGVEWSNDGDSRFHPFWGSFRNFWEILKIRTRIK